MAIAHPRGDIQGGMHPPLFVQNGFVRGRRRFVCFVPDHMMTIIADLRLVTAGRYGRAI